MNNGWIAVDLDGTLAHYDHWRGATHIGEPIPAMVERVKNWVNQGYIVKIFTARVAEDQMGYIASHIYDWCEKHLGYALPVTNAKDFGMIELWDDRCVAIKENTGIPLNSSQRGLD